MVTQRREPGGYGFKKVLFLLVQLFFFTLEALKGNCRLRPRVVVGDWPHSKSRVKYFILGTMTVSEDRILVENWGRIYELRACPQKEFFRKLDCGEHIQTDPYFDECAKRLDDTDFTAWLNDRLELWESFNKESREFIPIAIRYSNRQFIVQDGAHRLSLRSLRGHDSHLLGISLWNSRQTQ
jgi:hypothetical protein